MLVVCFGEILWDNFKEGKKAGGAPMNVALHLTKNGINSMLISSTGRDTDGWDLRNFLLQNHLTTKYIQLHENLATGIVEVELDELHQATYTIVKPVAWDEIEFSEDLSELVLNAEALVFGSLAVRSPVSRNTLLKLLPAARLKVFDMNLRPPHVEAGVLELLIKECDILKINEHELSYLGNLFHLKGENEQENLEHLTRLIPDKTILLTLGAAGAMVFDRENIHSHGGFKVEVADTVGAGDAFLATFISSYLKKEDISPALEKACAAGAIVSSKPGANPSYSAADIQRFISRG